jgi:hypothetical protein
VLVTFNFREYKLKKVNEKWKLSLTLEYETVKDMSGRGKSAHVTVTPILTPAQGCEHPILIHPKVGVVPGCK